MIFPVVPGLTPPENLAVDGVNRDISPGGVADNQRWVGEILQVPSPNLVSRRIDVVLRERGGHVHE